MLSWWLCHAVKLKKRFGTNGMLRCQKSEQTLHVYVVWNFMYTVAESSDQMDQMRIYVNGPR